MTEPHHTIASLRFRAATLLAIWFALCCTSEMDARPHSAAQHSAEQQRPNVLLIVSEDNGPELGCYGDPYARTPHLDSLAQQGILFERAFVPYSVCSPSRACFLTGLYPHQNGQIGLATHKFAMYSDQTPNLPQILQDAGYRTGIIGKLHVNPASAFPFDFKAISSANFNRDQRDMRRYADAATEFFQQEDARPFFLAINFPDAHYPLWRQAHGLPEDPLDAEDVTAMPWIGVDSQRIREQVANYYNSLSRLDTGVGMVLDELEQANFADETLVIYIGDHGAQFSRGKVSVYEPGLRIPFLIRYPNQFPAGETRDELVSSLDILPTICAAVGIEPPERLPGLPLQRLLEDESPEWREFIYGFTTGAAPNLTFLSYSIRDEQFKLIYNPRPEDVNHSAELYFAHEASFFRGGTGDEDLVDARPEVRAALQRFRRPPLIELYDLDSDPYEWQNLADDPVFESERDRLLDQLQSWRVRTGDPFIDTEILNDFIDRQLEMKETMSYRSDAAFRWPYLDRFPQWRERNGEE